MAGRLGTDYADLVRILHRNQEQYRWHNTRTGRYRGQRTLTDHLSNLYPFQERVKPFPVRPVDQPVADIKSDDDLRKLPEPFRSLKE